MAEYLFFYQICSVEFFFTEYLLDFKSLSILELIGTYSIFGSGVIMNQVFLEEKDHTS